MSASHGVTQSPASFVFFISASLVVTQSAALFLSFMSLVRAAWLARADLGFDFSYPENTAVAAPETTRLSRVSAMSSRGNV